MAKYGYSIQYWWEERQEWVTHVKGEGLEFCRGYVHHQRCAPGPRLACRLVRSDGRIMEEVNGLTEAGIGMVAGWPSAEQYRRAADRCIRQAERIEENDKFTPTNNPTSRVWSR